MGQYDKEVARYSFNGESSLIETIYIQPIHGCIQHQGGAIFEDYFTAFRWSNHKTNTSHDIQKHELLMTLVAIYTFSPLWVKRKLILWIDNIANEEAYYAGFCKNTEINRIIAQIYKVQTQKNFSIKMEHILGIFISDADLLLRSGHKEYLTKKPTAHFLQPDIPTEYTNIISTFLHCCNKPTGTNRPMTKETKKTISADNVRDGQQQMATNFGSSTLLDQ